MTPNRSGITALTVLGMVLLVVSATILGSHFLGHGRAGRTLSSAPLPPGLGPSLAGVSTLSPPPAPSPTVVADKPGIPVTVIIEGRHLQAPVSANPLNADGSLYVPPDPHTVSWASQDVGPGSSYGTTILVSHVNSRGVQGVFSDLADYRVGQVITLIMADGRRMSYVVASRPIEVRKDQLAPRRAELFDQSHSFGQTGRLRSGRLLLLTCGGTFDNRTGHYESNIFVFALPA